MSDHEEISVKVNAFVDEGIAELVSVLSDDKNIVTIESCQGGCEDGHSAWVIFRKGDWREAGEFLFDRLLPKMDPDLRACVSLKLQAYGDDVALAEITVDPAAISQVIDCIREM